MPGKSLIEYIIDRATNSFPTEEIVVATTTDRSDDLISYICQHYKVPCLRGPIKDKISRWVQAAELIDADVLICFDGDDPFTDLEIGKSCAELLISSSASLVKAINLPCGSFTYAVSVDCLRQIAKDFDTSDSEMMWTFFERLGSARSLTFNCGLESIVENVEDIRITVDYQEDLDLCRLLARSLLDNNLKGSARDILSIFLDRPQFFQINSHRQLEYLENQRLTIANMSSI